MTLTPLKTKAMILKLCPTSGAPNIVSSVDIVPCYKFLGVFIDEHLSFNGHVEYVVKKPTRGFLVCCNLKEWESQRRSSAYFIHLLTHWMDYAIHIWFP